MNDNNEEQRRECQSCGLTPETGVNECDACGAETCEDCGGECHGCGNTFCPDCRYTCACGNTLCEDCETSCEECGTTVCENCTRWCETCDETRLCWDCAMRCDECGDTLCRDCAEWDGDSAYCPDCWEDLCERRNDPDYAASPCWLKMQEHPHMLTIGLEIEVNGEHDRDTLRNHPLIAGWCPDLSLDDDGCEYQTRILTREDFQTISELAASIHTESREPDRAGGHMHVRRTSRQTPSRWYWALGALNSRQAADLNMRHATGARWCALEHDYYSGKGTAVNADHANTIELRTFGRWDETTAHKLRPALEWASHMWRYFENHERHTLKIRDITRESAKSAYQAPRTTPAMRLAARKENH